MFGLDAIGGLIKSGAKDLTPQNEYNVDPGQFAAAIQAAQANQANNMVNQNNLAAQLQATSMGQGANPAMALLNQQTNQLQQQQAGAIASQRGINPWLAHRQANQQAAQMMQQSAAQGAALQAQQSLGAQGQLSGLYNNIGNQALTQEHTGIGAQMDANKINAGVSAQNATANQATTSGLLGGAAKLGGLSLAHGGMVPDHPALMPGYAIGGAVQKPLFDNSSSSSIANQIMADSGVQRWGSGMNLDLSGLKAYKSAPTGMLAGGPMDNEGMPAPAPEGMPGMGVPMPGAEPRQMAAATGAYVPGKATVPGDSPANDTVTAKLSPGEIVLPRTVVNAEDAPEKAAEFVEHIMKNKKKKDTTGSSYARLLAAHRDLGLQLKDLAGKAE